MRKHRDLSNEPSGKYKVLECESCTEEYIVCYSEDMSNGVSALYFLETFTSFFKESFSRVSTFLEQV